MKTTTERNNMIAALEIKKKAETANVKAIDFAIKVIREQIDEETILDQALEQEIADEDMNYALDARYWLDDTINDEEYLDTVI